MNDKSTWHISKTISNERLQAISISSSIPSRLHNRRHLHDKRRWTKQQHMEKSARISEHAMRTTEWRLLPTHGVKWAKNR